MHGALVQEVDGAALAGLQAAMHPNGGEVSKLTPDHFGQCLSR